MELKLIENTHPNNLAETAFNELVGIEQQKHDLLNTLHLLFNKNKVDEWHKKYHNGELSFLKKIIDGLPLIILEGDVGCGKTALANCVATPLGKILGKRIKCFETPSDIRGAGRVGEISNRITQAFETVKTQLGKSNQGILIIDEADDLATSREQNQAHHEDRAGLNVLLKQIDSIVREGFQITVILITNRLAVLDPAIIRRSTQIIKFHRPNDDQRVQIFHHIFNGTNLSDYDLLNLVSASKPKAEIPFSYSDLIQKVGKQAIFKAIEENRSFSADIYMEILSSSTPTPLLNNYII